MHPCILTIHAWASPAINHQHFPTFISSLRKLTSQGASLSNADLEGLQRLRAASADLEVPSDILFRWRDSWEHHINHFIVEDLFFQWTGVLGFDETRWIRGFNADLDSCALDHVSNFALNLWSSPLGIPRTRRRRWKVSNFCGLIWHRSSRVVGQHIFLKVYHQVPWMAIMAGVSFLWNQMACFSLRTVFAKRKTNKQRLTMFDWCFFLQASFSCA